jgi:1-acyl-sn-glycerol-3-phosphate acyltransferase
MWRLNYWWRLLVTGMCFFGFSAGGGLLSAFVFPLIYLFAANDRQRNQWARWFIQKAFELMLAVLRGAGVMRLEISGGEALRSARDALVIANHPCLLDIVVLLSVLPRANCVVKTSFWRNPFVGGVVRAAGYINNSAPDQVIEECASALHAGAPLVIFPEGTRTRPDAPLKFLRGAAHIALKSARPIIPVMLRCDPPTLRKGSPWYEIPPRPFCIRVVVKPPLKPEELFEAGATRNIAARKLTAALERYFNRELGVL